jgi:hypothetical protein
MTRIVRPPRDARGRLPNGAPLEESPDHRCLLFVDDQLARRDVGFVAEGNATSGPEAALAHPRVGIKEALAEQVPLELGEAGDDVVDEVGERTARC